jgi:catechol 2,3-dioxygenase-like lactoylglutathione lyase family enzyme
VVNHVAFRVESLAAIEARGLELHLNEEFPGIASVYSPEGERIELFDDELATNIGFELDPGFDDPVARRHNERLGSAIVSHHLHFYLLEDQVLVARDWYAQQFCATPGKRWRYDAADLPGMNLNFSSRPEAQAATEGRMLDHIGFEVRNLEAFCRLLESRGIEFDQAYRRLPNGFALAFLTDPWGTRIELTEGLAEFL